MGVIGVKARPNTFEVHLNQDLRYGVGERTRELLPSGRAFSFKSSCH